MSKIIYVCLKDPARSKFNIEKKIHTTLSRITPDNISVRPPKIVISGNVTYGIMNPASSIIEKDRSVLLGMAFGDQENWWKPKSSVPDGSFSIFRSDEDTTEILTDYVGSRSVWYYHDENSFVASSSQRAIITWLGTFEFNKRVIPWMLSTGSLGPFLSWDKRIKLLPSDSQIILDHNSWDLDIKTREVKFESLKVSDEEHEIRIKDSLFTTFTSLKIDFSKWVLPLSGGFDSRGMLSLFHSIGLNLKYARSITWGLANAANQPGNDAFIAKKLADFYHINHKYYFTDISNEPIEDVLDRFLLCGEGRVDHIGGYLDGFKIWKNLFDDQIQGIIRGDEGFGRLPVSSPLDVRLHVEVAGCSDFPNLSVFEGLGVSNQVLPENFRKKEGESLETWRDRLYHQYRMPIVLAALSDLKLSFVEVISPLLSREILQRARSLPDHLRSDKNLFKKIVRSIGPKIGFATSSAIAETSFILKSKSAVDLFKSHLDSENCKSIFPEDFIKYVSNNLKTVESDVNNEQILKSFIKRILPGWVIKKASKMGASKSVGVNSLAFRIFIIIKMKKMLEEDSRVFS